ncbi:MAG: CBS domain-containing protein [Candidatus Promineifilaceae bacterium]|nr:CBS domain-containing protein [Candidatus Promineifilaceae bacterium]
MKQELVKDWMSRDVMVVRKDSSLPEAHQIMISDNIRRLPVVDDNGQLVGIITLGDVRSVSPSPASSVSIFERNYLLSNLEVERVMTPKPSTISPDQTINEAANIMLQERISGLPVVDENGQICGIITESDIFRMVVLHEWAAQD